MGVIRRTVQREVLDILNNSIFTVDDFCESGGTLLVNLLKPGLEK